MPDAVIPHDIDWTPERVSRFWDYYSSNPQMADSYFAKMVGRSLLKFVGKRIKIGTAVDIGCGPGDLIGMLIAAGHPTYGVDSSPASLAKVHDRFSGQTNFRGAVTNDRGKFDLPNEAADSAFMLEVVEHMDDAALRGALAEAHRILKPGGHLVLTTPNDENLEASRVMCPECGSIFHRVQHVRAWSADSLRMAVEPSGFRAIASVPTTLSPYGGPLGLAYQWAYPKLRGRTPHLVYIGRKV
jgi:SAM-dependent methyltransferase